MNDFIFSACDPLRTWRITNLLTYLLTYFTRFSSQHAAAHRTRAGHCSSVCLTDHPFFRLPLCLYHCGFYMYIKRLYTISSNCSIHNLIGRVISLVFLPRPYSITEFQCQHAQQRRKIHIRYKNAFLDQYHRLQNALLFRTLFSQYQRPKTATFDDLLLKVQAFFRGR